MYYADLNLSIAVMISIAYLILPCFYRMLAEIIKVSNDYGYFFNIICAKFKAFSIVYSLKE